MSESRHPTVLAVIIAWNRVADLRECLRSFESVTYPAVEILVVDNGSEDDTVAMVRREFPHVHLVEHGENRGYVGGCNTGFQWALKHGADYVLVLNQDIVLEPDVVDELVRVAESDPRIAVTGAKNILMEDPRYTWGKYGVLNWGPVLCRTVGAYALDEPEDESPKDVDWVIGNGCLIRTSTLKRIGLFDEELFHLNEDVEWCTRARKTGFRVVYVDSAAIRHHGSSTGDITKPVVFFYAYFLARNAILVAYKHAGPWEWVKLVSLMTLGLFVRLGWYWIQSIYEAVTAQEPFLRGMLDGWDGTLRRDHITVRQHQPSLGSTPGRRFLRWWGV